MFHFLYQYSRRSDVDASSSAGNQFPRVGSCSEQGGSASRVALSFASGCVSGALARMSTNAPRDIGSQLQSNKLQTINLSKIISSCTMRRNLTACTLSTSMQYAAVYGCQAALKNDGDSVSKKAMKDGVSAIAGGLVIHPATVAFYHQNSDPSKSGRVNLLRLIKHAPQDLLNGLKPRVITSTTQWMTFFAVKDSLERHDYGPEISRGIASISGVLVATPSYQACAYQCRSGASLSEAFSVVGKSLLHRPIVASLFAGAAAAEMFIGDLLQARLELLAGDAQH